MRAMPFPGFGSSKQKDIKNYMSIYQFSTTSGGYLPAFQKNQKVFHCLSRPSLKPAIWKGGKTGVVLNIFFYYICSSHPKEIKNLNLKNNSGKCFGFMLERLSECNTYPKNSETNRCLCPLRAPPTSMFDLVSFLFMGCNSATLCCWPSPCLAVKQVHQLASKADPFHLHVVPHLVALTGFCNRCLFIRAKGHTFTAIGAIVVGRHPAIFFSRQRLHHEGTGEGMLSNEEGKKQLNDDLFCFCL